MPREQGQFINIYPLGSGDLIYYDERKRRRKTRKTAIN
jgi:hypothetical protein